MPRRRKPPPDNRLDWRDPNMLVLRLGFKDKKIVMFEVAPEKIEQYYKVKMLNHPAPHYSQDETYFLKRLK